MEDQPKQPRREPGRKEVSSPTTQEDRQLEPENRVTTPAPTLMRHHAIHQRLNVTPKELLSSARGRLEQLDAIGRRLNHIRTTAEQLESQLEDLDGLIGRFLRGASLGENDEERCRDDKEGEEELDLDLDLERDLGDAIDAQLNQKLSRQESYADCQIRHISMFNNEDGFNLCKEAVAQQEDPGSDDEYDPRHSITVEPPSNNTSSLMRTTNTPHSTLRPSTPPNRFEIEPPGAPRKSRRFRDAFNSPRTLGPPTRRSRSPLPSSSPTRSRKRKRVEYQSRKPDHKLSVDDGALGDDEKSPMFSEFRIG